MELCDTCTINDVRITEAQLIAGWEWLVLHPKLREKLTNVTYGIFDTAEARASADLAIRKIATGRAIALCLTRNCITDTCPRSPIYKFANIDDPELLTNL